MTSTVYCIACIVLAVLVCLIWAKRDADAFAASIPPISDEEFLARCSPGTNPHVALKVRKIVAKNLGVDYERIYPSTRFVEDLGAD